MFFKNDSDSNVNSQNNNAQRQKEDINNDKSGETEGSTQIQKPYTQVYQLPLEARRSLTFRNGRLKLYSQERDDYLPSLRAWLAATSLWTVCLSHSLMRRKVFRTIFFGGLFYIFSRNMIKVTKGFKRVIRRMDLHEDGRHVDIIFADGTKMIAEVHTIQRLSEGSSSRSGTPGTVISAANKRERISAQQNHQDTFENLYDEFIPLIVNGQVLALDKNCKVENRELFDAVTRGLPVRTDLMVR
jgi:hypothetical protein